jgi:hypothetical protein
MATATVVTEQHVDAVIAQLERIERERDEAQHRWDEERKAYEEKRLRGHSHWAIVQKFARGATKGKGSRVFIENEKIFSYGHHFVLATRKEVGDWGCGIKFLVNGDRVSVSTSGHTNLVIGACKPNVQVPYSALQAAGLAEAQSNAFIAPCHDLRIVARGDDRWYAVCCRCGRDVDNAGTFHLDDESDTCPSENDRQPWRYEHVLGGVVMEFGGRHYLSGIDHNEPWRLRSYFLCLLPKLVSSIADAYDCLKPSAVRKAESVGLEIRRQGDVFLAPVTKGEWNPMLRFGRDRLAKDYRLWEGTHEASRALIADGRVFVTGKLTHARRQHRTLYCKGQWYEAFKNTALASWNAIGSVD